MKRLIFSLTLAILLGISVNANAWWGPGGLGPWGNNCSDGWFGDGGFDFSFSFGGSYGWGQGWNYYDPYWGYPYGYYPYGFYPYGSSPYFAYSYWGYPYAAPASPAISAIKSAK